MVTVVSDSIFDKKKGRCSRMGLYLDDLYGVMMGRYKTNEAWS